MFEQALKDIESINRDVAVHELSYKEYKDLCPCASEGNQFYHAFDIGKKTVMEKVAFAMETKIPTLNVFSRRNFFNLLKLDNF